VSETLVIGLYEDTGETFTMTVVEPDAQTAIRAVATEVALEQGSERSLILLGAVVQKDDRLEFVLVDVDHGLGAYAEDLAEEKEESDDGTV
jgi:hypothetical protein